MLVGADTNVTAGDLERVAGLEDLPLEVGEVGVGADDGGAQALGAEAGVAGGCDCGRGLGESAILGWASSADEGGAGGGGRGVEHAGGGRYGCFEVLLVLEGLMWWW